MFKQIEQRRHLYRKNIRQTHLEQYKWHKRQAVLQQLTIQYTDCHMPQPPIQPISPRGCHNNQANSHRYAPLTSTVEPQQPCVWREHAVASVLQMNNEDELNNLNVSELMARIGESSQSDEMSDDLMNEFEDLMERIDGFGSAEVRQGKMEQVVQWVRKWEWNVLQRLNKPFYLAFLYYFLQSHTLVTCAANPNIFSIISAGLSSSDNSRIDMALTTLLRIIKQYDKQDMLKWHEHCSEIPALIISILSNRISTSVEYLNILQTIRLLIDSFDQIKIQYAYNSQLISLCSSALHTEHNHHHCHIQLVLDILYFLAKCPLLQLNRLLQDQQGNHSRTWLAASIHQQLHKHPRLAIRKRYLRLLSDVVQRINGDQLRFLCDRFAMQASNGNMLTMMGQVVQLDGGNTEIEYYLMKMINRFLRRQEGMNERYLSDIKGQLDRHGLMLVVYCMEGHKSQMIREVVGSILDKVGHVQNEMV